MSQFFPRKTTEIRIREPRAFRRLSYSLIEMALVTGVVVRTYRLAPRRRRCAARGS